MKSKELCVFHLCPMDKVFSQPIKPEGSFPGRRYPGEQKTPHQSAQKHLTMQRDGPLPHKKRQDILLSCF
jgi:hypothetical protein